MKLTFKLLTSAFLYCCAFSAKTTAADPLCPVSTCDPGALPCTKELLVYLHEIIAQKKVLFGHQNDTNITIRPHILSDTEDLTGDISGIVGLDTQELTGNILGCDTQEEGLKKSIQTSLDAAERGALITLSSHMPNFSSPNIQMTDDGYSFLRCPTTDAKNLSNNCAAQSLPGGQYNPVFNAYLDIIAEYGLQLQQRNIPVMFRPFHEGNGDWFWWGTPTSPETYIALYRYTKDYLTAKGVHNFLYVYSPNGPVSSEAEYAERYPGDDYVDIVAIDSYHYNHGSTPQSVTYNEDYLLWFNQTCKIVHDFAVSHEKIPAISETGIWVRLDSDPSHDGLLEQGNPMDNKAWYQRIGEIAVNNQMAYYLVWTNMNLKSFHIPFNYDDTHSHEMSDDFIDFYQEDYSVFAGDVHFYERIQ